MGLYNFKAQFVPFILSGSKTHTIRARRAHPDKPGNMVHLYTGLRTRKTRLLLRSKCVKVEDVMIRKTRTFSLDPKDIYEIAIDGVGLEDSEKEQLARCDGFMDFSAMMAFWTGRLPFVGHIIHWRSPKLERKESARELRDLLSLVECVPPLKAIKVWTPEQKDQAQNWAAKVHLRAGDHIVRVPDRPAFLDQFMVRTVVNLSLKRRPN